MSHMLRSVAASPARQVARHLPQPLRHGLKKLMRSRDPRAAYEAAWHDGPPPPHADLSQPLQHRFWTNTCRRIDKWHHYLPIYERHFAPFRDSAATVLEIGVQNGGSLQMWRDYFGPEARLVGIDIDPGCAALDGEAGRVMIGSQSDPAFLAEVLAQTGPLDVVIDDGSHRMHDIRCSLAALLPHLRDGGVYLIEDLHTAYWHEFGGGLRDRGNFFSDVMDMIDDLHMPYHAGAQRSAVSDHVVGIHAYDSVVVLDKGERWPPRRSVTGGQMAGSAGQGA